ncbi:MAG: 3-hydroxyacyl-CoA dehydrogenase [Alphaproteobacteria bacterium]|jgi:3-hydroxybutyryl-CoA dehydrogenase|nr:3-hydroxyacyl-CoA dehydrogenase [Alphaproteobacteria bacterium]
MNSKWQDGEITIGVLGAGVMGRGIAQVAATGGMRTLLHDSVPGAADKAAEFIHGMLDRGVARGRMSAEEAEAAKGRLEIVDGLADFARADAVIEAIIENLEIKQQVFQDLEEAVGEETLIASNTSSFRIAAIAARCRDKSRIGGMHFFNPVPLMKLVEVVRAPSTTEAALEAFTHIGRRMGRIPVEVQDGPGFLVNLGGRAFYTEGLRFAHENIATPSQVDAIMRDACGFRMGPFELMDLTGMDVNFPSCSSIYNGYFQDRRLTTYPLHEGLYVSGRLGRKTGVGHYEYDTEGNKIAGSGDAETDAAPADKVFLAEPAPELEELLRGAGAEVIAADDGAAAILAAPLGEDCTAVASRLGLDHRRLVAVDLTGDIARRLTVMTAPGADPAIRDQVVARLRESGAAVTAIHDSPGFVAQRMLAAIGNLGSEMAQIGIAQPADIDTAMTLGLNYPQGPLALVEALGADKVLTILQNLQAITGEERYRPSQWLRRRALLDLPITTAD